MPICRTRREVILEPARRWREGFDVVDAVRRADAGEKHFKRKTATLFYRFLRKLSEVDIPADLGDFRLVDRNALEAYKTMREEDRFVRGMFSWIGFKQAGVPYERDERYAGKTKYPLRRMLLFAIDGIVSFSNAPLRLALALGLRSPWHRSPTGSSRSFSRPQAHSPCPAGPR
jgi:polyisoprenyl-phosphate glycosyltransferase